MDVARLNPKACFCCRKIKRYMMAKTIAVSTWKSVNFHLCFQCQRQGRWFDELEAVNGKA